ncbi:hypothetical protein V4D30_06710 [Thermodesulfovibrio sp. 3907-1M]|uniref:Type II secretion system protein GspC N-terminal domain-containing protein n=1 Tax=Thermodesulfovibrio autotrophicus TaxID=3118333 RepID=A0AAU8GTW5_9BACT
MIKEFKISIAIFIVSFLFLGLSLKIKPPSFVTPFEKNISEYALPEITIKEKIRFLGYSLNNPFETSKIAENEKKLEKSTVTEIPLPVLSFIYEGRNKYAVIGNSIVKEGDIINGYQIKGIFKNRVLIKDKKGELKWLKLENY